MRARVWFLRLSATVAFLLLGASVSLRAQGRPGGGGGPGGMGQGGFPGGSRPGGGPPPGGTSPKGDTASTMHGGLQMGPPGRWWDDKHFSRELNLRHEQQRKMDAIFEANRGSLLTHYQALQQEEEKMGTLTRAAAPNEEALFSQIDHVAQARADLEKANTHFLLQLRREMDTDQISRLEEHR